MAYNKKPNGKNATGRPKKEIDKLTFEGLCKIQCTKDEICNVFDCDEKTLTRWCKETYSEGFSDIYKKKSATGKASLRRLQFKLAEKNPGMAIFLGKNYLGQSDKQEIENTNYSINTEMTPKERDKKIEVLKEKLMQK